MVDLPLHQVTRNRFLNYAVSVITSRALPDVRDGLKPVQRRILYTMYHDLRVTPDKSTLKCAKVVGQVLGNYHPHGDSAVYEAMVRMAQPWSLRYPLVFGQGNFGSLDGDGAAAYRYTEARLEPIAIEFCDELAKETVDFRANFDETQQEPEVLPARFPQLLANGCTGIAVGVATNIPPHNLKELTDACQALIENSELTTGDLMRLVKGPDFPTGGEILEDRRTLTEVYEKGQGRIRLRGEYVVEEQGSRKGPTIIITSIPYQVNKSQLVEQIGEIIIARKVPQLVDVRDESTHDVRIVLECRREADPGTVMAYLYKHTQLRSNFHVNMTCLIPQEGGTGPARVGLKEMLLHFNRFRLEVVTRRTEHELRLLRERIHVLEGFRKVFDHLDEALNIIRNSEGRKDAATKLMVRFELDQAQVDAVLELRLYKLGRPDVLAVRQELEQKRSEARRLEGLLGSEQARWALVKSELAAVGDRFGDKRRTRIMVRGADELSYEEEDFIVDESAMVLLTRDGWIRRVQKVSDLRKVRMRQGDELVAAVPCRTLSTMVFFSNYGTAYSIRVNDIPAAARGYGDPVQKFFNFSDGEGVVSAVALDEQLTPGIHDPQNPEQLPALHALAVGTDGRGLRFSLHSLSEPSTRSGRRYARALKGEEMAGVSLVRGDETLIVVSREGRALLCRADEVNFLSGPGKGVTVIKLVSPDSLLAYKCVSEPEDGITVVREEGGREIHLCSKKNRLTSRGGRGALLIKRGRLTVIQQPLALPEPSGEDAEPAAPPADSPENSAPPPHTNGTVTDPDGIYRGNQGELF
ncbi:MAG: DNA topoisomerase IV subunit A [Armatimonadetes bacterium]|nr:DNA topoisomerase IV subunit A [Armatimonadota bacterium]